VEKEGNAFQVLVDSRVDFDIVIADSGLPDTNAFQLVKEIKEWYKQKGSYIQATLFVSEQDRSELMEKLKEGAIDDLLPKNNFGELLFRIFKGVQTSALKRAFAENKRVADHRIFNNLATLEALIRHVAHYYENNPDQMKIISSFVNIMKIIEESEAQKEKRGVLNLYAFLEKLQEQFNELNLSEKAHFLIHIDAIFEWPSNDAMRLGVVLMSLIYDFLEQQIPIALKIEAVPEKGFIQIMMDQTEGAYLEKCSLDSTLLATLIDALNGKLQKNPFKLEIQGSREVR
jgi:two-component sensor histidine kinase